MQTAYQIMKLNEYSVTSWLSKVTRLGSIFAVAFC